MHVVAKLLYLNLICLLFSLPIITIFPSIFALVKLINDSTLNEETSVKSLFHQFKDYFFTSIESSFKFALIIVPILIIVGIDLVILSTISSPLAEVVKYAVLFTSFILFIVSNYALFLYTTTAQSLKHSWMLGLIYVVKNPLHSLFLIGLYFIFLLIFLFQTGIGVLFIFSLPCYLLCKTVQRPSFRRL